MESATNFQKGLWQNNLGLLRKKLEKTITHKTTRAFKKTATEAFFRALEYKAMLLKTKDVSDIQTNIGHT